MFLFLQYCTIEVRGYVSRGTVLLRRFGVLQDNLVLSTGSVLMWIGHPKEIRRLRLVSGEVITAVRYNIYAVKSASISPH